MSAIVIQRAHGKTLAEARSAAEQLARALHAEFDMKYDWEGDTLRFSRTGVHGEMAIDAATIALTIRLGLLLLPMKAMVETEIHRYFDENFPLA